MIKKLLKKWFAKIFTPNEDEAANILSQQIAFAQQIERDPALKAGADMQRASADQAYHDYLTGKRLLGSCNMDWSQLYQKEQMDYHKYCESLNLHPYTVVEKIPKDYVDAEFEIVKENKSFSQAKLDQGNGTVASIILDK